MINLSDSDLQLLESLEYRDDLQPWYDPWLDCLLWDDEWPKGLSVQGVEFLDSLVTARSLLHDPLKRRSFLDLSLDVDSLMNLWEESYKMNLQWPGFRRTQITQKDLDFLREQQHKTAEEAKRNDEL